VSTVDNETKAGIQKNINEETISDFGLDDILN